MRAFAPTSVLTALTVLPALALTSLLACRSATGAAPTVVAPATNEKGGGGAPARGAPGRPDKRLPSPEYLPPEARLLLSDRMQRHGFDMTNLMWAMLFLENDVVAEIADGIAAGPWLVEPEPGEDDQLNALLPRRFFELQGQLAEQAKALAAAARAKPANAQAVGRAFGALSETCVTCHATYLYGDAKVVGGGP
ncbi:MAG: cytochrome c [Deltaproteobacteria bacterium]|nr:cytochrome c [Deltaproteobacteria bacterium]